MDIELPNNRDQSSCKNEHHQPSFPISRMCSIYFKNSNQLVNFVGFICGVVLDVDKKAKIAAKALFEVDAIVNESNKSESHQKIIEQGLGAQKTLSKHRNIILEMMVCRATDNFLTYVSDLLVCIFKTRPETLKSSEKMAVEEILNHENMDELIVALAEKKINNLSYYGMEEINKHLSDTLNFQLFDDKDNLSKAIDIIQLRNLITHNRGRVNRQFLRKSKITRWKEGVYIDLDTVETFSYVEFWNESVNSIERRAVMKYGISQSVSKIE